MQSIARTLLCLVAFTTLCGAFVVPSSAASPNVVRDLPVRHPAVTALGRPAKKPLRKAEPKTGKVAGLTNYAPFKVYLSAAALAVAIFSSASH